MDPGIAKHVGAGLLAEVEEESLEMLLIALQQQATLTTTTEADPASTSTSPATSTNTNTIHPKLLPLPPALREIIARQQKATTSTTQQQQPVLSITGRYLPLLYHLISTLIAAPHHYAIIVIDPEWRFDVTRLVSSTPPSSSSSPNPYPYPYPNPNPDYYPATPPDLRHVHVFRPSKERGEEEEEDDGSSSGGGLRAALLSTAREWMLYASSPSRHPSRDREWWGTVVVSGSGSGGGGGSGSNSIDNDGGGGGGGMLVTAGWKGWLKVEREEVGGFVFGGGRAEGGIGAGGRGGGGGGVISVEEALAQRDKRGKEVVERTRWVAGGRWGGYAWRE